MSIIIFLGLFILPYIFNPIGMLPFEIPRMKFFVVWTILLFILALINKLRVLLTKIKNPIILLTLFFLIWSLICSLLGTNWPKSLTGNHSRADGLILTLNLFLFSLAIASLWQEKWQEKLIKTVFFSQLFLNLWLILNYASKLNLVLFKPEEFLKISFGNVNFLAGYLLITLPFIYQYQKTAKKKTKWLGISLLVVQIWHIILTQSIGPMIGIGIFGLLLILQKLKKLNNKYLTYLLLGLIGIFTIYYLNISKDWQYQVSHPENRLRVLVRGIKAWQKKPIFGWGIANFDHAFNSINWPYKTHADVYFDKAHSHFLETLVTTGIVGLLIYLSLINQIVNKLLKIPDSFYQTLLMVFILFLFHSQTNVISIAEEIYFWVVLGIISSKK